MRHFPVVLILLLSHGLSAQVPAAEWQLLIEQARYHKLLHEIETGMGGIPQAERVDWFYWQGKVYLQLQDWRSAQQAFHQGLLLNARSVGNLLGMASCLYEQQLTSDADHYRAKALKNLGAKHSEEILLAMARMYEAAAQIQPLMMAEARRCWYEARLSYSQSYRADWALAHYYEELKVWTAARSHFDAVLYIRPDYAPALLGLARIELAQGHLRECANLINQSLAQDPELPEAYRYRGELWLRTSQLEKARQDYRTYLYYTGGDPRSWLYYAAALYLQCYYWDSLEALAHVDGSLTSLQPLSWRLRAYCWADMGRWDSAQYWLETFEHEAPDYFRIPADNAYWGAYLVRNGQFVRGDSFMQTAIAQRPHLNVQYQRLAHWWTERKSFGEAGRYATAYIETLAQPPAADLLWAGKLHYFAGAYEQSYQYVRQSLPYHPSSVEACYWWGICAAKLNLRYEMKEAFSQLVELLEDVETLNAEEQTYFLQACTGLALYYYQTAPDPFRDCETARMYASKALAGGGEKQNFLYILADCQ